MPVRFHLFQASNQDREALSIAGVYLVIGALWILFSDPLTATLTSHPATYTLISILKGWVYVIITTLLLYVLIRRHTDSLRNSEERYRLISENAGDVIWILDLESGRFKYTSPSVVRLRGWSPEQVQDQTFSEAFTPESLHVIRAMIPARLAAFAAGDETVRVQTHMIDQPRQDGSIVHTEVVTTLLPDAHGVVHEMLGVTRDVTQRWQAEQALAESESRFRTVFEHMAEGVALHEIVYDDQHTAVDYRILSVNPGFERHTGLAAAQVCGQLGSRAYGMAEPPYLDVYARVAADGQRFSFETFFPPLQRHFQVSASSPGPGQFVTVFQDVTDRQRAEETLRTSENRYRSLFENMLEGYAHCRMIWEQDEPVDFVYLDVNAAFERLTGLSEVVGKPVSQVIPGLHDSNPELFRVYGSVAASGQPAKLETYLPTLGIWLSIAVYSSQTGHFVAVFDNITERKGAEQALRASEERYRAFFASRVFGTLSGDVSGNIRETNDEFLRIVGYSRSELEQGALRWTDLTPPEFLPLDATAIAEATEGGVCTPYEKQYVRKDGTRIPVLVGFILVGPQRQESLAFILDLTALKQKESEIRRLNTALEQRVRERTAELEIKNRELETFTYSVSHDLKAPLRGIDGYSRLLLEQYADRLDDDGHFFLRTIRQATEMMNQLIDDLLAYSRLERRTLTAGQVDPRSLVDALIAERSDEITARHIAVVVEVPAVMVTADADGVIQVLRNLLDNAIKFTLEVPEPHIEIGGRVDENTLTLWVRDNGIGFDMQFHDRIFEIFQRLHRSEAYPGTGIGLAIVRKAIERMDGQVWATSVPGQGATFFLEIPR